MKKDLEDVENLLAKSEESNKQAMNKRSEEDQNWNEIRAELERFQALVQKQDRSNSALRNNIREDREIIQRYEEENEKLSKHVGELEGIIDELGNELRKEKKSAEELEELVCALNQNRNSLEEQLGWMKAEEEKRQREIKEYDAAKQELAEARKGEMQLLQNTLSNVHQK